MYRPSRVGDHLVVELALNSALNEEIGQVASFGTVDGDADKFQYHLRGNVPVERGIETFYYQAATSRTLANNSQVGFGMLLKGDLSFSQITLAGHLILGHENTDRSDFEVSFVIGRARNSTHTAGFHVNNRSDYILHLPHQNSGNRSFSAHLTLVQADLFSQDSRTPLVFGWRLLNWSGSASKLSRVAGSLFGHIYRQDLNVFDPSR